ncbi:hypothetical protein STEG23_004432 [Scotinomys teguina]
MWFIYTMEYYAAEKNNDIMKFAGKWMELENVILNEDCISAFPEAHTVEIMAFDGSWKVDRNENYDKFMEKMGINVLKRKVAAHDNLKLIIKQEGSKFTIKESSRFRNIDVVFELGVNFDYTLADGTEVNGTWSLEENKLIAKFKRIDNGKELIDICEISGGELIQTYIYEGVEAKRIFKKE